MVILIVVIYCCAAIFFGSMLERMSLSEKYRTTERVKMGFWSGFLMSSVVFVPFVFFVSSITQ